MHHSGGPAVQSFGTLPAPEISEIAGADGSILIVPVGSIEQHGEHLPVATDTILVSEVVSAAVERLDDVPVLTTPAVWSGYSPHHLSFGGTLSGEFSTLQSLLLEIGTTGLGNGFDAILFVNGHGGNSALIDSSVSELGIDQPDAEVLGLTYFELATGFIDEIRDSKPGGMAHGGEFETSLLLHLYPELVGDDRPAEYLDEPYDLGETDLHEGGPLAVYRSFEEYSASGAIGDPSVASADKGAQLLEKLANELATCLGDIHRRNS